MLIDVNHEHLLFLNFSISQSMWPDIYLQLCQARLGRVEDVYLRMKLQNRFFSETTRNRRQDKKRQPNNSYCSTLYMAFGRKAVTESGLTRPDDVQETDIYSQSG